MSLFAIDRRLSASAFCLLFVGVCGAGAAGIAGAGGVVATDAKTAGADYERQGEYTGNCEIEGQTHKLGVQVIALGKGEFEAVAYLGGLPGDGWNGEAPNRV